MQTRAETVMKWYWRHHDQVCYKRRETYAKNPERQKAANATWRKANPKIVKAMNRRWRSEHPEYKQVKSEKYLAQQREWTRKRRGTPEGRLEILLRNSVARAIKEQPRQSRIAELVGCSVSDLRKYIESLWKHGMNWENHGNKGWHIDHIIPISSFDLTIPKQRYACFNFRNLQPLWATENLRKGNRILPSERKVG